MVNPFHVRTVMELFAFIITCNQADKKGTTYANKLIYNKFSSNSLP